MWPLYEITNAVYTPHFKVKSVMNYIVIVLKRAEHWIPKFYSSMSGARPDLITLQYSNIRDATDRTKKNSCQKSINYILLLTQYCIKFPGHIVNLIILYGFPG